MASFPSLADSDCIVRHSLNFTDKNEQKQEIEVCVKSFKPGDYYATNLNLTGLAIWFGAYNMTDFAQLNLDRFKGKTILELGAGVGLCGISIAKLLKLYYDDISIPIDQAQIVLSDGENELLPLLSENCIDNGLSPTVVECSQLWWGTGPTLDLYCEKFPKKFDCIIGADLIYSKEQIAILPSLFHTVKTLLSNDIEAAFYLAVTRRNFGIGDLLAEAIKNGFVWSVDENTIYDIFDNNIDEQTIMWRDSIYIFRRECDESKRVSSLQSNNMTPAEF